MGSLNDGSARLAAFNSDVFPKGLDLRRSVINTDLGTYKAAAAAVLRAGQFVAPDANGEIIGSIGADTIGVSKWNKQQFGISVNVDEVKVLPGTTVINLTRPNVSNVSVRSLPDMAGTLYTGSGTDYTIVAGAGTIVRVGGGAIADGATVYVTYTYALTDADFEFDGRDFRNQSNNDVLGQENMLAVVTDWSQLYSMEWDSGVNYANVGATSRLFVSAEGKATSAAGTDFAGKVKSIPNAEDPFLGMILHGNPV